MDPGQEVEDLRRDLACRDPELLIELALSGALDAHDGSLELGTGLSGDTQGVRAAGIGPQGYARGKRLISTQRARKCAGGIPGKVIFSSARC